jgi:hypothetical protein
LASGLSQLSASDELGHISTGANVNANSQVRHHQRANGASLPLNINLALGV